MEQHPTSRSIHAYDTENHRILCGIPGHTSASKHAANVTCPDCRRLLDERTAGRGARSEPAATDALP